MLKTRIIVPSVAALLAASAIVIAQQQGAPAAPVVNDPAKQKMMEEAMATMNPAPEHERLHAYVGEWTQHVSFTMEPGAPAVTSQAKAVGTLILGGRFLKLEVKGEFMGQPFEALNIMGFDRRHNHYTIVGFDTLGTYSVSAQGSYDPAKNSLVLAGESANHNATAVEHYRFEYDLVKDNQFEARMIFTAPGGQEFTLVKILHTRP